MTRALLAWIYTKLDECVALRARVDTEEGLRRMDKAQRARYSKIVCFGRPVRGSIAGYEHRPMENQVVVFSLWVRPESPDPGDLALEDLEDLIVGLFVQSRRNPVVNQDCAAGDPGVIILDAVRSGPSSEAFFDEAMQSWTKSFRIQFTVQFSSCEPVQRWCGPCAEG